MTETEWVEVAAKEMLYGAHQAWAKISLRGNRLECRVMCGDWSTEARSDFAPALTSKGAWYAVEQLREDVLACANDRRERAALATMLRRLLHAMEDLVVAEDEE